MSEDLNLDCVATADGEVWMIRTLVNYFPYLKILSLHSGNKFLNDHEGYVQLDLPLAVRTHPSRTEVGCDLYLLTKDGKLILYNKIHSDGLIIASGIKRLFVDWIYRRFVIISYQDQAHLIKFNRKEDHSVNLDLVDLGIIKEVAHGNKGNLFLLRDANYLESIGCFGDRVDHLCLDLSAYHPIKILRSRIALTYSDQVITFTYNQDSENYEISVITDLPSSIVDLRLFHFKNGGDRLIAMLEGGDIFMMGKGIINRDFKAVRLLEVRYTIFHETMWTNPAVEDEAGKIHILTMKEGDIIWKKAKLHVKISNAISKPLNLKSANQ